jgi:transposase-like protein
MRIPRSRRVPGARPPVFRRCPGCDYDFLTDTGKKACGWYDCPYLPEELKVTCPECNYNFATGEGTRWCGEPPDCRWAAEGYRHAENARRFQAQRH